MLIHSSFALLGGFIDDNDYFWKCRLEVSSVFVLVLNASHVALFSGRASFRSSLDLNSTGTSLGIALVVLLTGQMHV